MNNTSFPGTTKNNFIFINPNIFKDLETISLICRLNNIFYFLEKNVLYIVCTYFTLQSANNIMFIK